MQIVTDIKTLRQVSRDVTADDHPEEIAKVLLEELERPLDEGRRYYLGLAANQLGFLLRMIVMRYSLQRICLVNPVITKERGRQSREEMCESLPGKSVLVERPKIVTVKGLNQYLEPIRYKFTGRDAHVACHEIDHLNGKLIIDYE